MKKLIILDYTAPIVHIYDVDTEVNIDDEYIEKLGINTNCACWMFGNDIEMIYHKEILK